MYTTLLNVSFLALALSGTLATASFVQAEERERSWSFTYNDNGLLESSAGPRTV